MSVPEPARSGAVERDALAPLMPLVDACQLAAVAALERRLTLHLHQEPTKAEQRVADLLPLADILRSSLGRDVLHHSIARRQVPQEVYDRARSDGALSAEALVHRFGGAERSGWFWACRAADGLLPDGRKRGPGLAWSNALRGKRRAPRADPELVVQSIRKVAFALGYRPSSSVYVSYVDKRRQRARANGGARSETALGALGLLPIGAVYQHFADWPAALAEANITYEELAAAREAMLPPATAPEPAADATPADRLAAADARTLAQAGLSDEARERLLAGGHKALGRLPLSRAVALAHALGCSLDWLAGRADEPGELAPAELYFDGQKLIALRNAAKLREEGMLRKARMSAATLRAFAAGHGEPSLAELVALATAVGAAPSALIRE